MLCILQLEKGVITSHESTGGHGDESDDDAGEEGDAFYDDEDAFVDVETAPESLQLRPGEGDMGSRKGYTAFPFSLYDLRFSI